MNQLAVKIADELADDFLEIQKPRSDAQLSAFVAGQHDTTPRQWQQVVLEIQIKVDAIQTAEIKLRQMDRKIKTLRNGSEEDKDRCALLMIGKRATERAMLGAHRELESLYSLYKSMPRFTRQQIEDAELDYWQQRITRQAMHGILATGRIGVGDLDSMRQLAIPIERVVEKVKPCLEAIKKALGPPSNSGTSLLPLRDTSPADANT